MTISIQLFGDVGIEQNGEKVSFKRPRQSFAILFVLLRLDRAIDAQEMIGYLNLAGDRKSALDALSKARRELQKLGVIDYDSEIFSLNEGDFATDIGGFQTLITEADNANNPNSRAQILEAVYQLAKPGLVRLELILSKIDSPKLDRLFDEFAYDFEMKFRRVLLELIHIAYANNDYSIALEYGQVLTRNSPPLIEGYLVQLHCYAKQGLHSNKSLHEIYYHIRDNLFEVYGLDDDYPPDHDVNRLENMWHRIKNGQIEEYPLYPTFAEIERNVQLIGRAQDVAEIHKKLILDQHIVLVGSAGVGKSEIMKHLYFDPILRYRYSDADIVLVDFDFQENSTEKEIHLHTLQSILSYLRHLRFDVDSEFKQSLNLTADRKQRMFDDNITSINDIQFLIEEISNYIQQDSRRILIMVDNVNTDKGLDIVTTLHDQLRNTPSALIISTRYAHFAENLSANENSIVKVQPLNEPSAFQMLQLVAPQVAQVFPQETRKLATIILGGLPLLIQLVGSALEVDYEILPADVEGNDMAESIRHRLEDYLNYKPTQILGETSDIVEAIDKLLVTEFERLSDTDQKRYARLGVFAPRTSGDGITYDAIIHIWDNVDSQPSTRTIDTLRRLGIFGKASINQLNSPTQNNATTRNLPNLYWWSHTVYQLHAQSLGIQDYFAQELAIAEEKHMEYYLDMLFSLEETDTPPLEFAKQHKDQVRLAINRIVVPNQIDNHLLRLSAKLLDVEQTTLQRILTQRELAEAIESAVNAHLQLDKSLSFEEGFQLRKHTIDTWRASGHLDQALMKLEQLVEQIDGNYPLQETQLKLTRAQIHNANAQFDDAIVDATFAASFFEGLDEEHAREHGIAHGILGIIYESSGEMSPAIEHYTKALAIFREADFQYLEKITVGNIGLVYFNEGNYEDAIKHERETLEYAYQIGDSELVARWLGNLGNAYRGHGEYEKANDYLDRGVKLSAEIFHWSILAWNLSFRARLYIDQENYEDAIEDALEAARLGRSVSEDRTVAYQHMLLGQIYRFKEDCDQSILHFQKAHVIYVRTGAEAYATEMEQEMTTTRNDLNCDAF